MTSRETSVRNLAFGTRLGWKYAMRITGAVLIALVLLTPVTSGSADPAQRPRLAQCSYSGYGFEAVRTSHWNPGCTGGSPNFIRFHWPRWGRVAVGLGRVSLRVCDPHCWDGYQVIYRARLRASRPFWCNGVRMYGRVVGLIRYKRGNPLGHPPGWDRWPFKMNCAD